MSDQEKAQDLFSLFMKKQIESKKKESEVKIVAKKKPEKSKDKSDPDSEALDKENQEGDEE